MNRLWIRFSVVVTVIIIFATIFAVVLIFLTPLLNSSVDEIPSGLSQPPLTLSETQYLIDILSTHQFDQLDVELYSDGFFSVFGFASPGQIEKVEQALLNLDISFYLEPQYLVDNEPNSLLYMFSLDGQLAPGQIDSFIKKIPTSRVLMVDDPLLVENLSLIDILQLYYEQVWQAIITSVVLGIGFGILFSRTLTSPLSKLTEATKAISGRDLSYRVKVKGSKEIEELADSFNRMAADLERAESLRRQLIADVSHELRTPLTGLESNLRAALDKVHKLEERDLARLYHQTNHLIHLVNDLHEISLAEARRLPLDKKQINLATLVQQTTAIFAPIAEEKGATLNCSIDTELPLVEIDGLRMRQVLHNLLANAVRHTPKNGTIAVTLCQDHAYCKIMIKDTGDGISSDHVQHIFDRFYRTDPSRSRDTGGTGLGLAIAKAIVEAQNGTLTAYSQGLNYGTTMTITIPL